jgi:hypothetical protein
MGSAGVELEDRLPRLVAKIVEEHPCKFKDGALNRILAHAKKQAQWLGQVIEAEEVDPGSCS